MSTSASEAANAAESSLQSIFEQSVVPGSSRYFAAHFSHPSIREPVKAALCFAHAMDQLAVASDEVIREKSVWWHDELARYADGAARHPLTLALANHVSVPLNEAMHEHLHGALSTQQRIELGDRDEWLRYADLRFGSLHKMLGALAGLEPDALDAFSQWAGRLCGLGIQRAMPHLSDARFRCPVRSADASEVSSEHFARLQSERPGQGSVASEVMLTHDRRWWRRNLEQPPPFVTSTPLGVRGVLASWRAARATPHL